MALPIEVQKKNVYLSYNFEANHGMPTVASDFTNGLLQKIIFNEDDEESKNFEAKPVTESRKRRGLSEYTRKRFYQILEDQMDMYVD